MMIFFSGGKNHTLGENYTLMDAQIYGKYNPCAILSISYDGLCKSMFSLLYILIYHMSSWLHFPCCVTYEPET